MEKKKQKISLLRFLLLILIIVIVLYFTFFSITSGLRMQNYLVEEMLYQDDREHLQQNDVICKAVLSNSWYVESQKVSGEKFCEKASFDLTENNDITYKTLSKLKYYRNGPDILFLSDGNVLVLGGNDKESAELLNPENGKVSILTRKLDAYFPKDYHCEYICRPVKLPDGNVFYKGSVYNVKTKVFSKNNNKYAKQMILFDRFLKSKKDEINVLKAFEDGKILYETKCVVDKDSPKQRKTCSGLILKDPFDTEIFKMANWQNSVWKLSTRHFNIAKMPDNKVLILENKSTANSYDLISKKLYNPYKGTIKFLPEDCKGYILGVINNQRVLFLSTVPIKQNNINFLQLVEYNPKNDNVEKLAIIPDFNSSVRYLGKGNLVLQGECYIGVYNYIDEKLTIIKDRGLSLLLQTVKKINDNRMLFVGGVRGSSRFVGLLELKK